MEVSESERYEHAVIAFENLIPSCVCNTIYVAKKKQKQTDICFVFVFGIDSTTC